MLAPNAGDGRQWFVLTCEPNRERTAASHLIARDFKPYLPEISVASGVKWGRPAMHGYLARRKIKMEKRPMFRGYIFVQLRRGIDNFQWAQSCPGVRGFLRLEEHYAVVSDRDMQRVVDVEFGVAESPKEQKYVHPFTVGESVRISNGVFSGFNADIVSLDDEERITLLLGMLGRAAKIQISSFDLEKL